MTRALIIIIAPIVILQSILTFVFLDRHWQVVTRRLSTATAQDIAMLASTYELMKNKSPRELDRLAEIAQERLNLSVRFLPVQELPLPRPRPFFGLLDRYVSDEVRYRIHKPFWIDTLGQSDFIEIRVKLDGAVMRVVAQRAQLMPSNTHIFIVWMVVSATALLIVAILFLRNQIRPILSLADAADRFGRGRPAPTDFKVRGAREVRLAAQAFLDMRERIERHVEQRTIMLAGVSHDLRTILTRFRLQLAMMRAAPQIEALKRDVDEMQQMLEDYLAFAKGDSGRGCEADRRSGRSRRGANGRRSPRQDDPARRASGPIDRRAQAQRLQAGDHEPRHERHALCGPRLDPGAEIARLAHCRCRR